MRGGEDGGGGEVVVEADGELAAIEGGKLSGGRGFAGEEFAFEAGGGGGWAGRIGCGACLVLSELLGDDGGGGPGRLRRGKGAGEGDRVNWLEGSGVGAPVAELLEELMLCACDGAGVDVGDFGGGFGFPDGASGFGGEDGAVGGGVRVAPGDGGGDLRGAGARGRGVGRGLLGGGFGCWAGAAGAVLCKALGGLLLECAGLESLAEFGLHFEPCGAHGVGISVAVGGNGTGGSRIRLTLELCWIARPEPSKIGGWLP